MEDIIEYRIRMTWLGYLQWLIFHNNLKIRWKKAAQYLLSAGTSGDKFLTVNTFHMIRTGGE